MQFGPNRAKLRRQARTVFQSTLRASPRPLRRGVARFSTQALVALNTGTSQGRRDSGSSSAPVPVPPGLTIAEIEKTFQTWSIDGEAPGHLDDYVTDSLYRFLHTWDLVRDCSGTCLELGASPYFTTWLLEYHTDLDLELANYFGAPGQIEQTLSFVDAGSGRRQEKIWKSSLFNVEEDAFPYADDSFDVVIFCEMLEHLLMDPLAAFREIRRVLRPDGVLVVTTPNVARIENVLRLIGGDNLYDPYSGYGPYGRHNREYTLTELEHLLKFAGFEVERSMTADGHPFEPMGHQAYLSTLPLIADRSGELGQYLFTRARPKGRPHAGLPSFLYRSRPPGEIVEYS